MELRCKNCQARISVPSVGPLKEVQCPKCGAMMLLPPPTRSAQSAAAADTLVEKKHRNALRRVFDPIPRSVQYTAGIILALTILSPFWVFLISERLEPKPVFLADDAQLIPVNTNAVSTSAVPMMNTDDVAPALSLTQFAGIRLETRRDELDHRFNLTLQNTRGMQPEIYTARPGGDIDQVTAHFYDGLLKEFTLVLRERLLAPATVQKQLAEHFGVPSDQRDLTNDAPAPGLTGLGLSGDALTRKLAGFRQRRLLVWSDANHQVDATIYSSGTESAQPLTVVQVRLAATTWLRASRPMVGSSAPVPAVVPVNTPERLVNPIQPLDRKLTP